MKRLIIALLVGGAFFGAIYGLAETLNLDGGVIQAGSDTDLTCTSGARVDGWGLETNDGNVYFVRIHDIDAGCEGNDLFVKITDGGTQVREASVTIPADGAAGDNDPDAGEVGAKINFSPYPAEDITDIEVFIEGGG
jgi:hypothetical protein